MRLSLPCSEARCSRLAYAWFLLSFFGGVQVHGFALETCQYFGFTFGSTCNLEPNGSLIVTGVTRVPPSEDVSIVW